MAQIKSYFLSPLIVVLFIGSVPTYGIRLMDLQSTSDSLIKALKLFSPDDNILVQRILNTIPFMTQKLTKIKDFSKRDTLGEFLIEASDLIIHQHGNLGIESEEKIIFHLYKPELQKTEVISSDDIPKLKGKIFFVIHGWSEDITDTHWYEYITKSILEMYEGSHVIQVDWGVYSNAMMYVLSALRTEVVAQVLTKIINKMIVEEGLPKENLVLIGFSLGGQITGLVGKKFFGMTNKTLHEIIALDPAGPLFEGLPSNLRLHKTDADTVMVIHSDSSFCGYGAPCGTIDFYPNGGHDQPGCDRSSNVFCSHLRSPDLFASALSSPMMFPAIRCKSYEDVLSGNCDGEEKNIAFLGELETEEQGLYLLGTTSKYPFYDETNEYLQHI